MKLRRKLTGLTAVVFSIICGISLPLVILGQAEAAGSSSINLSPSSQSVTVNNTFDVTVAVNPAGETAVGAQVKLTFDNAKLQYQSMVEYTTPLDAALYNSVSGNTIQVTRATFGSGGSTTFNFIKITFKAIAAGSATVVVQPGTEVTRASDGANAWNGVQTSATYTISNPVSPTPTPTPTPTPSPTPTPTPSPNPTPTPSPTPTPTPSPTPSQSPTPTPTPTPTPDPVPADLIVSQPAVTKNSFKRITISMVTARPVKARVVYGLEGDMALSTPETELTTNPTIEIPAGTIVPGRTYTYAVAVTEESGNATQTTAQTFVAKGYHLKLSLKYADGSPVRKKRVQLHTELREAETDDNGDVSFEDVEAGDHTISFEVAGATIEQPVTVAANEQVNEDTQEVETPVQTIELQIDQAPKSKGILYLLGGFGLGALAVAAIVWALLKRKAQMGNAMHFGSAPSANNGFSNTPQPSTTVTNDEFLKPDPPKVSSVISPEPTIESNKEQHEEVGETQNTDPDVKP